SLITWRHTGDCCCCEVGLERSPRRWRNTHTQRAVRRVSTARICVRYGGASTRTSFLRHARSRTLCYWAWHRSAYLRADTPHTLATIRAARQKATKRQRHCPNRASPHAMHVLLLLASVVVFASAIM
ncbi:unnamed protein product, partial [Mycena citricolor]